MLYQSGLAELTASLLMEIVKSLNSITCGIRFLIEDGRFDWVWTKRAAFPGIE